MLFDLDALLGDARRRSIKWRWLACHFNPRALPDDYAWEIAVFVNTPGISVLNVRGLMYWSPRFFEEVVNPVISEIPREIILPAAEANAASINAIDARDLLIALGRRRDHADAEAMPIYATMWLQEQWRGGRTEREIAREVGISAKRLNRLKLSNGFVADRWL